MTAITTEDPFLLDMREVPDPEVDDGEVSIAVEAAGVGLVDVLAVRGQYAPFPGPGTAPGVEVAGRVVAAGPAATASEGDRVLAITPSFGGLSQRVVVDSRMVLAIPSPMTSDEAVAFGINALVAERALSISHAGQGQRVLVRGAGGGIGILAVQLATARGALVTAITSSQERARELKNLGAVDVIIRPAQVPTPQEFDVIIDPVAGPETSTHMKKLNSEGRYVLCGAAGGAPDSGLTDVMLNSFHRSPSLLINSLSSVSPEQLQTTWEAILHRAGEGLVPVIGRRYSLRQASEALRAVASGEVLGKVIVLP